MADGGKWEKTSGMNGPESCLGRDYSMASKTLEALITA